MFPTLITVLRDHDLPAPPTGLVDTAMTIASFSFVDDPAQFAIAYYRDTGTAELRPPLYVLRYDKLRSAWHYREFALDTVSAQDAKTVAPDDIGMLKYCFGSASMKAVPSALLVATHVSPSAECTRVLRPDLTLATAFAGWEVANLGSVIIYEHNEIHFSATNPLRLFSLNLAGGRQVQFFPPDKDPLLEDFQRRLSAVADEHWCREHDASCDPLRMTIELRDLAVNEPAKALAFEVMFESEGFGEKADAEIGGEKYFYIFKLAPKLEYREFDEFDMKPMFGETSAKVLVRPDVLRKIFAPK